MKKHGRGDQGGAAEQAREMLAAFTSVGAQRFDLTLTDITGGKAAFRPGYPIDRLSTSLTTIPAFTLGSTLVTAPFKYEILVNFLSPTTVQSFFELDVVTATASGVTAPYSATPSAATTVSLSSAKVLVTTVTFSAISALNTISLLGGWTERVA